VSGDVEPTVYYSQQPLPQLPLWLGKCCREWPLAHSSRGVCGQCGEKPEFVRWLRSVCWACGDMIDMTVGHECEARDW